MHDRQERDGRSSAGCLDSARPLVDYVLVVDTGSRDGTQADDPRLSRRAWRRASDRRAVARLSPIIAASRWTRLRERQGRRLRADHRRRRPARTRRQDSTRSAFKAGLARRSLRHRVRHGGIAHRSPAAFQPTGCRSVQGVLHEYLETPPGSPRARKRRKGFDIETSHGGARTRRTRASTRTTPATLERALATETDPFLISRYTFYLAQSYRDCGEPEKALANYEKRRRRLLGGRRPSSALRGGQAQARAVGAPIDEVIHRDLRGGDRAAPNARRGAAFRRAGIAAPTAATRRATSSPGAASTDFPQRRPVR